MPQPSFRPNSDGILFCAEISNLITKFPFCPFFKFIYVSLYIQTTIVYYWKRHFSSSQPVLVSIQQKKIDFFF